MDEQQKPKRNIFAMIIPYILVFGIIATFVGILINRYANKTVTWSQSEVTEKLNSGDVTKYVIYSQYESSMVTVKGSYEDSSTNKSYTFQVNIYENEVD